MSASAVMDGLLWVEKHRPVSLDQLGLDEDIRHVLEGYLAAGEVPHLLLVGPPGSGKTTVARILTNAIDCRVLTLNASTERGTTAGASRFALT